MNENGLRNPTVMWEPRRDKITNMDRLRENINERYRVQLQTYKDFYKWSCDNYAEFWGEVWLFTDVVHSQPYDLVVDKGKTIQERPEWFHGVRMNFAENLLQYDDDRVAIYAAREGTDTILKKTYRELRNSVAVCAAAMKKMGIQKGDRVVGYISNCCEGVEAMLAAASIGAIWSSTSPDFGVGGVLDRFTQISPKLIFSINAVYYNGKIHNHLAKLEQVVKGMPGVEKVIVIPFLPEASCNIQQIPKSCLLAEFLDSSRQETPVLQFEQVPFSHPLYIMYSSGTTGAPKCMVHSVGGTLLKHLEEHVIQGDMGREDVMLYYTTVGWMMWNWLVSVLAVGASIVLYDGSPLMPHPYVLWDLVDRIGITTLGSGAKWLSVLEERGVKPGINHNLKSLKMILSTGSPLKPQSYEYVYRDIKSSILLGSISGGTDIIASFMGHNWTVPVYKGEIQSFHLGCAMECWDEDGNPVCGERGELICTKPFPSMPVYFWNDPDGLKYKKAYFAKYSGVWAHGDYCLENPETGGIVMLGRSDGTLNPNGVRFGSAEIYQIVESFQKVEDSLCVAQRNKDGTEERVVLFLRLTPGSRIDKELITNIRNEIRTSLSSRHLPAQILQIDDIPYTISGKKVEVAVRRILAGEPCSQHGALANPESLDLYVNIPALQGY